MLKLLNDRPNNRKPRSWTAANEARGRDISKIIEDHKRWWPLTERMVYYRLISSNLISGAHWHKYGDSSRELVDVYSAIGRVLKWLRIHERVPWESITDDHRVVSSKLGFESYEQFLNHELTYFLRGYRKCVAAKQEYYIEVWIEKAALFHMVKPVADRFCRRTVACKGYASISFQADFFNRASEALMRDQKPIILYFGDWDPSGCDMPYAIMRTLEDDLGLTGIQIYRCGINPEHFPSLHAEPVGVKDADSRSKSFIREHGTTAYELDAFEPSELQMLVRESLMQFTDMDQVGTDMGEEENEKDFLSELRADVIQYVQERLG
jgi:hypothetical protein